jgi:hypothetical protein
MRQFAAGAGLPDDIVTRIGPHAGRFTFATLALDAGVSLRDLQDAMRHKDPRTTCRYDKARERLDRSPGYRLADYLAAAQQDDPAEGSWAWPGPAAASGSARPCRAWLRHVLLTWCGGSSARPPPDRLWVADFTSSM